MSIPLRWLKLFLHSRHPESPTSTSTPSSRRMRDLLLKLTQEISRCARDDGVAVEEDYLINENYPKPPDQLQLF